MQEQFEWFNRAGELQGKVDRSVVHSQGLWHRSAQVFAFNPAGQLLLQQRAADKDLYPSLWDYSVGEHLQPGESFLAGAKRGLVEELGLTRVQLEPVGSLRWVEQQGTGYIDREIQQAYRCVIPDLTNVQIDHVEVQQVAFVDLAVLAQNLRDDPGLYTPWLAEDLQVFGWVDVF